MNSRLFRSRSDRMLAGVAGGLGAIWGVDTSLIRIVWALLVVLTGGIALVLYILMAIIVPDELELVAATPGRPVPAATGGGPNTTYVGVAIGGILVLAGVFFLVREFLPEIDFDFVWPLVLIGVGIVIVGAALTRGVDRTPSSPPAPPVEPPPPPPPPEGA